MTERWSIGDWRRARWGALAAILLLPLVTGMAGPGGWDAADFALMAALLFGAGALFELALWATRSLVVRAAIGVALAAAVTLGWAHGAVGVF